ncbi:MAG: oligosaccharide flippase family protein, partial [Bacteroidota bacterium]
MTSKRNWTNLNDFWRNVITLVSGNMLATGLNLAALPVLSRLYLPDEFGIFGVFVAVIAVAVVVVNGGLELAIMLPKDEAAAQRLTRFCLLLAMCLSAAFGLVDLIGGNWLLD